MTIQEAIKSGRPFRRKSFGDMGYIECPKDKEAGLKWVNDYGNPTGNRNFWPREEDLLAKDWELEEIKLRRFGWVGRAGEVRLLTVGQGAMEGYVRAAWLDEPEVK